MVSGVGDSGKGFLRYSSDFCQKRSSYRGDSGHRGSPRGVEMDIDPTSHPRHPHVHSSGQGATSTVEPVSTSWNETPSVSVSRTAKVREVFTTGAETTEPGFTTTPAGPR